MITIDRTTNNENKCTICGIYLQLSIVIMQGKSKHQTKQQNWIMQRQQWMRCQQINIDINRNTHVKNKENKHCLWHCTIDKMAEVETNFNKQNTQKLKQHTPQFHW